MATCRVIPLTRVPSMVRVLANVPIDRLVLGAGRPNPGVTVMPPAATPQARAKPEPDNRNKAIIGSVVVEQRQNGDVVVFKRGAPERILEFKDAELDELAVALDRIHETRMTALTPPNARNVKP